MKQLKDLKGSSSLESFLGDDGIMNVERITRKGNLPTNSKPIPEEDLNNMIEEVFTFWRNEGFPDYPKETKWRDKKFKELEKADIGSLFKNKIIKPHNAGLSLAWSYMSHHWGIQCGTMKTPEEIFNDDIHFRKGIRKLLTGTFFPKKLLSDLIPSNASLFEDEDQINSKYRCGSVLRSMLMRYSGTQVVSNFRPTAAAVLYQHFAFPGANVQDMSMGYGGRILGAIISDVNYIGTDPATETFKGNTEIAKQFGRKNRNYQLHKLGSEVFQPEEESIDFAFTSPPYFNWEKYSEDEGQSFKQFSTNEEWNNGFLRKTMENVKRGLKKGKVMAMNVADIKSHKTFEKDTVELAKSVGYEHIDTFRLQLSSQESGAKYEPVFIFKK